MAIYHLSVKTIGRSEGRSATAAAAYRSGDRIADERTGLSHDYTRRGGIEHTEIFLPEHAPQWAANRERLWNAAEAAEKRINSTVAREFEVALPTELSREERRELVREMACELVKRHGLVVDASIHKPGKIGDHRNYHAHILCSTRRLGAEGFTEKSRELDDRKSGEVEYWRKSWAEACNRHLSRAGHEIRVDNRSLEAQGIERTPGIHLGPNVIRMERRGIRTDRGDTGRKIEKQNEEVLGISAKIIDFTEARKRIEAAREAELEILRSVQAVNAKLRALTEKTRKQTEAEQERASQGAAGDFVRDRVTRKEKETVREGPAVPSKEGPRPVGDDPAERVYIKVPYGEKDAAKAKGAKWDPEKRSWYVPAGVDLAGFGKWLGEEGRQTTPEGHIAAVRKEEPGASPVQEPLDDPGRERIKALVLSTLSASTPAEAERAKEELESEPVWAALPGHTRDAVRTTVEDEQEVQRQEDEAARDAKLEEWFDACERVNDAQREPEQERQRTPAGREIAVQEKPEEVSAPSGQTSAEQEQSSAEEEVRRMEQQRRYIAEGVSRMKARAHQWSADKKAAAIAKEKALAEERAAREKALALEKAAQEAERDRRAEMSAVLEKEADRSAWQGKRPIVEAALKEYPELAGTAAALEALARQPGFSSGSFEDRNRLMNAIGKASELIEKGEPLRGAKDPRVEKIARETAKEYELENERGMSR
ncbi:MAG: MobQ family relaxase [Syntrophobacteraceae bacterium]